MPGPVVIHIGLHKTGTRYLQRDVFGQLEKERFAFNPPTIAQPLYRAMRPSAPAEHVDALRSAVADWRQSDDQRTLVLSEPHASGDMYGMHAGYAANAALLGELFPEARIIYLVRNHADWLLSAYRQSLVKDPGQPIERFLNYRDDGFQQRPAPWVGGNRNVAALDHDFLAIYRAYARAFGTGRVYLLRQEDLRRRPEAAKQRIADALGMASLPPPAATRTQNRSFSALAIQVFFPGVWLRRTTPPRNAIGVGPGWLRQRLKPLRKLRVNVIRHVFDRLVYIDWDLLSRHAMREQLEAHYADRERELGRLAGIVLSEGPQAVDSAQTQPSSYPDAPH